jgi:hypothetical protein
MKPAAIIVGCLLLGAAAPAATVPAAPLPEDWSLISTIRGGGCAAKTPLVDGVSLGIALAPNESMELIFGNDDWKIEKDYYDVRIRLGEAEEAPLTMFGNGPSLIGPFPVEKRPALLAAGKISFSFFQKDFTVPLRDLPAVLSRLETCIAQRNAGKPGK